MGGTSDRDQLIAIDSSLRQRAKPPGRVWDLVAPIHAAPGSAEMGYAGVGAALPLGGRVARGRDADDLRGHALGSPGRFRRAALLPPWACVVWAWPSKRLLAMLDISGLIPAAAIGPDCAATAEAVASIEQVLASGQAMPPGIVARLYELVFRGLPLLKLGDGVCSPAPRRRRPRPAARKLPVQQRNPARAAAPGTRPVRPASRLVRTRRLPDQSPRNDYCERHRAIGGRVANSTLACMSRSFRSHVSGSSRAARARWSTACWTWIFCRSASCPRRPC